MYDVLIKNGTIIDGSGKPMFQGSVALKEKQIVAVGKVDGLAERVIDATGHYVAPGFIDVNNHSDTYWELLAHPELESMLRQGVTTIIGGNSGSSLAPLARPEIIRSIQKWTDVNKINFSWLTLSEFFSVIEKRRPAINFATLVGHGTIRRGAMQDETRPIKDDEVALMERMLKNALKEGAMGFSTGLMYTHARGANIHEILRLVEVVRAEGGVYSTYVRDESEGLVRAVEEAVTVARKTKIPLHISHLKAVGKKNWPLMDEVFNLIETAALNDIPITFDVYPYTTTGSVLYTFLPTWITENGRKLMLSRLRDPEVRATVIAEMRKNGIDYSSMLLSVSTLNKMLSRRKISDIAAIHGKAPEEVVIDVLLGSEGRAIVSLETLSEKNVQKAIQHPFSIISSNGVGYNLSQADSGDKVHPRNFGTFPKVFAEYVRNKKALSWEEAVHKMTGKPAQKFRLDKRGLIQEGYRGDIVIFDPETIEDRATMEEPYQYPAGITWVIVNGILTIEQGVYNGKRPGEVLRHKPSGWFSW
ncbi:MAG: D-aminoacylase [Candidatus Moraniibacteriota bacterium]